jgi:hypothetical protein
VRIQSLFFDVSALSKRLQGVSVAVPDQRQGNRATAFAALLRFESGNVFLWMLNVLSIPATIRSSFCMHDFEDKQSTKGIAVTLLYLGFRVSRGCDQNACFGR